MMIGRVAMVAVVVAEILAGTTAAQELTVIPQSGWSLRFVDSEETAGEDGAATNAFDGDPATIWHTQWSASSPPHPHELQIDLGATYDVGGFRYLPRQNSQNGRIASYEFYTSLDATNWNAPAATGTFPDGSAVQQVTFAQRSARYVRLRTLTEVAGRPFAAVAELNVLSGTAAPPPLTTPIPQSGWTLRFVDSEETVGEDGAAANAFDGDRTSIWHTQWFGASPPLPHEMQLDLGAQYDVAGFRYLPRQDSPNGRIARYEFYVSGDGTNWGAAAATGTFTNGTAEREVLFTARRGRFVRLRALSEVSGRPFTSVAELNVLAGAASNLPPNGVIEQPAGNMTIAPGGTVDFGGAGTDPDGNLPLSFRWDFGNGQTSSAADPAPVTYASAGQYTVTFTVTDLRGTPDPTPDTRTITVGTSPAGIPIPQANWTLHYVDSEETVGEDGAAINAFDGDAATIWHTQWLGASPPLPHELQIDLRGVYTVVGFRYLPRQNSQNGRIGQYEFYTSHDGTTWGPAAAAGVFVDSPAEQQVSIPARTARYVRLRTLSEVAGRPFSAAAELNVLATGNLPPNGTITSPATNLTVQVGDPVVFRGTGSDPDNNLPLTFLWHFGNGQTSRLADPPSVTYAAAGVYTVTFTATDSKGLSDPVPDSRIITVQGGSGSTLVPRTNWTVRFVDSEELVAENGRATNAFDGDPSSHWASEWLDGGPAPPHEIQIDLGASYSVAGFRYLPVQSKQDGRVGQYQFYVSGDGTTWGTPVASGAFPDVNSGAEREVTFVAKTGRYVRFRALSEVNGADQIFSAIAELNVLRTASTPNQPPTASITSPAASLSVPVGSAILLTGAGADPEGTSVSYRWSVTPGSGISDLQGASPGLVHFDRPGVFVVTLTVTDALGRASVAARTVTALAGRPLTKSAWSLAYVDSQETAQENGAATNAFDGDPATYWHTRWSGVVDPMPHEIQINLGSMRDVSGLRYLPRQSNSNGRIARYEFYVSVDGVNWGSAVAAGTFPNTSAVQQVLFAPTRGQFVRLRALSDVNGTAVTSLAELDILERPCPGPSVRLTAPRSLHLQSSTKLQVRVDACRTAASQGVRVVVDGGPTNGGTQVDLYLAPYAVAIDGLARSEHQIDAFLIDGAGARVAGPASADRAYPVGIGEVLVGMGDGVTLGYSDNYPQDDNSADGRTTWGGYTSILADALTAATRHPVTVVNAGVGGAAAADGATFILTLLQRYPHARYFLVNYGHNDYVRFNAPSGLGLRAGLPGYTGSFKHSLQRIIDAVRAAGRTVILSRAAPVLPLGGAIDTRLREYNQVVDELAQDPANGIPVAPPDFYNYFAAHQSEFANAFEMNGIGYQSMARLWRQALCPLLACTP